MTRTSRRNFLRGVWRAHPLPVTDEDSFSAAAADGPRALQALPPEFSSAMLRMEGQRLGLPAEAMEEEELARAVLRAMHAGAPLPHAPCPDAPPQGDASRHGRP
ncbi:apoptosis regulator Bcl-2 [Desulfovibrio sp.]|uniref:apoptosis regulator Bcl-2 n=1 Tax=Desulfovibrio sp. TaxID=885 RepID=UPI0025BD7BAA|nr:apoptosis regulator Bcl-2 [Desulfovibrio sp.]